MTQENFFDRKFYLDILEKRVSGLLEGYRQNIAIIGDELVGKTSIIFKLLNKFYDTRILFIYLEIRPESLSFFAKRFIGTLLYNLLANSGIPLKEDLDFLIERSEKYIPKTVERIKQILTSLEKKKRNNIFADLLSLCETIKQETEKSCVVVFDEFCNLENIGIKNIYKEWTKLLVSQKNTMYIIVSSLKFKTRTVLSKNLSLLFGNFEVITVEPFDIKTSEEYLNNKLSQFNLNSGLKNFIIYFTAGFPFYLEVIADSLLKNGRTGLADIIENLLFDSCGILNQRFSNYLKRLLDSRHSQEYLSILYFISSGHNKLKDIAHILRRTKKELALKIGHLLELDIITRNGDFLKINDRVFGFWLRFVYQERLQSLTFDAKNQKSVFRKNIEGIIEEFIHSAQRPVMERMHELLRLFEDEVMQFEKKRLKLNHFKEIKSLEFNKKGIKDGLIGRSNESIWIMAFKYGLLTEEDIGEFAKECKKYHHKLQRKIIVAFNDVDTNAKLRALDEKIWMWDLNNLNQVFDVFCKPRIIV